MKVTQDTLEAKAGLVRNPGPKGTVVDRLKYLIVIMKKTQVSFAHLIGLNPTNLSKVIQGRMPVTTGIINRILVNTGVSKEWLTIGNGVPFPGGISHQPDVVMTSPVRMDCNPEGAPVYDLDVTAGAMELSAMFTQENVMGFLNLPGINHSHPLVRVSGDSMMPRIAPGGFVQIRPVSDPETIFWGSIYVVVMEDYRMVKVVRRHHDPNMVILHSVNPNYDDMDVPRSKILAMYMVETILNYDIVSR